MLTRKVRKVGTSLVVTIPSQIAEAYGYDEGEELEIKVINEGILLKKIWSG
jgi:AbrB family looped-hinge helix DNA binding protein